VIFLRGKEIAMGLFDKLKDKVKGAAQNLQNAAQPQAQAQAQPPQPQEHQHSEDCDHEEDVADHDQGEQFDLAGFDPINDEAAFFNAVLHMESEGMFGGTDESRAEISARYGIRDHSHWLTVKESNYAMLARKYGSYEEVSQQEINWRSGQMQHHGQAQQAAMAAKGGFDPVEGVTLEAWAAINASIIGGANWEDLLKGAGIDKPRWDRVSAEWNARMARDTTFAITTVYGNAFQAASKGKYGDYAREANAARAAKRELAMPIPMTLEQYWTILYEQDYGAKQGKDPVETLKASGLSIVDWTDLSTFMGYYMNRTVVRDWAQFEPMHDRVKAQMEAKYPGVKTDVDISF
jgi:hypothetical protein